MKNDLTNECGAEVISPSVGESFMSFAETYYQIDKLFDEKHTNPQDNSELMPYNVVKQAFIHKIDELIRQKLSQTNLIRR